MIIRSIVVKLKKYSELVILSHILFSLPFAAVSVMWAAHGIPEISKMFWIFMALFGARNGANALNRIADRKFDSLNPRTATRLLPLGKVTVLEAWCVTLFCFAIYFFSAFMLSPICFILSPIPFVLFVVYSYSKRITSLCHFILGTSIAGAPMGAGLAISGHFSIETVLLSVAVGFWTSGFDILYAIEDIDFDNAHLLHSLPAKFGSKISVVISSALFFCAVVSLMLIALVKPLGFVYFIGICIIICILTTEILLSIITQKNKVYSARNSVALDLRVYKLNQAISICFLIFCLIEQW